MCAVVSLQLAAFGEGFHAGGAVEDPGLLGAGRRPRLVQLLMLLRTDSESSEDTASTRIHGEAKHRQYAAGVCVCVYLFHQSLCCFDLIALENHILYSWSLFQVADKGDKNICFCDGS